MLSKAVHFYIYLSPPVFQAQADDDNDDDDSFLKRRPKYVLCVCSLAF